MDFLCALDGRRESFSEWQVKLVGSKSADSNIGSNTHIFNYRRTDCYLYLTLYGLNSMYVE